MERPLQDDVEVAKSEPRRGLGLFRFFGGRKVGAAAWSIGSTRLPADVSLGATNVRTGASVYFDNKTMQIGRLINQRLPHVSYHKDTSSRGRPCRSTEAPTADIAQPGWQVRSVHKRT